MNSVQYEELCRRYIAKQFGLGIDRVESDRAEGMTRPGAPALKHQIDLIWKTGGDAAEYLNIANAKWRGTGRKVNKEEVQLLKQVKEELQANKAFLLTNVGFTGGARAVAENARISLHIVNPSVDVSALPAKGRDHIQHVLASLEASSDAKVWTAKVEYRAVDPKLDTRPARMLNRPRTADLRSSENRVLSGGQARAVRPPSTTNRSIGPTGRGGADRGLGPFRRG